MASEIQGGKRQVRVWASAEWVTVLHGKEKGTFRVLPEDASNEFIVIATTNEELNDRITAELRRRNPKSAHSLERASYKSRKTG